MIICKRQWTYPWDYQNREAKNPGCTVEWNGPHPHPHPASYVPLILVVVGHLQEDGPNNDQNQRDVSDRIVANDHPYHPASYVPLILVVVGHLQRGRSQQRPKSEGRK